MYHQGDIPDEFIVFLIKKWLIFTYTNPVFMIKKNLLLALLFIFLLEGTTLSATKAVRQPSEQTKQKRNKKKKKSLSKPLILLASLGVTIAGVAFYFSLRKRTTQIKPPIDVSNAMQIFAKHPQQVKIMKKYYGEGDFFTTINLKDSEVILTDAANASLTGGGGTTGGIWSLREKEYGGVKNRKVFNLDGSLRELNKNKHLKKGLEEGEEVVISTTGDLTVAHLCGVKTNTPESRKKNAVGIRKIVQYGITKKKSIVFCAFSAGIFAGDNVQMKKDMEANLLLTLADEIKKIALQNNGKFPIKIIINDIVQYKKELQEGLSQDQILNKF